MGMKSKDFKFWLFVSFLLKLMQLKYLTIISSSTRKRLITVKLSVI